MPYPQPPLKSPTWDPMRLGGHLDRSHDPRSQFPAHLGTRPAGFWTQEARCAGCGLNAWLRPRQLGLAHKGAPFGQVQGQLEALKATQVVLAPGSPECLLDLLHI